MKYFIFLGFLFFPVITFSDAKDTKNIVDFLIDRNSAVTSADNIQRMIENSYPHYKLFLNIETFFNSHIPSGDFWETPLESIARRLQNEEEIIRFLKNTMRYMYEQLKGDERSLQKLFSFIYEDTGFTSVYGSEKDYPKVHLFLSKLKEFSNTEEISKAEIEELSNKARRYWALWVGAGSAVGFVIGIVTGIGATDPLLDKMLGGSLGYMLGFGVGATGNGISRLVLNKKKQKITNQIKMCRQAFIEMLK